MKPQPGHFARVQPHLGSSGSLRPGMFPAVRMRRNRRTDWARRLVAENTLTPSDLIWPMFVAEGLRGVDAGLGDQAAHGGAGPQPAGANGRRHGLQGTRGR